MRTGTEIALGLLDISQAIGNSRAAEKFRELTLSWSRYGYREVIFENDSVDGLLAAAEAAGFRYCFVLPYGYIVSESWQVGDKHPGDFFAILKRWIEASEFLVGGTIVSEPGKWYGLQLGCLLVDLDSYRRLAAPAFALPCDGPRELPCPRPRIDQGHIAGLSPTAEVEVQCPQLAGWNFICSSLNAGLPVRGFTADVLSHTLNLEATCPLRREALLRFSGDGISSYPAAEDEGLLSRDQRTFLDVVSTQAARARRGVFLWNIESYADIETPRDDFPAPVSTLYSVAAGFKPNRILHTHGFTDNTKVVFFDYSRPALEIKKCMVEQWDGDDFPRFVRYLFTAFPHPETFYQLWNNATPLDVNWDDIDLVWQRELQRWGGAGHWREHWRAYRELEHEYVCCDLLADADALLDRVAHEPGAIIWWSNAFFTMYGNWAYTWQERREAYDYWVEQLAARNPPLYLFGSDINNSSVNDVQAAEYWDRYRQAGGDCLTPCKLYRTEMRM